MNKPHKYWIALCMALIIAGCAPVTKSTRPGASPLPSYPGARNLYDSVNLLTRNLVASTHGKRIGKIAVVDFVGPNGNITALGEYISDKVGVELFSYKAFSQIMSRERATQQLRARAKAPGALFDQNAVAEFGKTIGADGMVMGTIKDMGEVLDVTAKIVESATGRIQGAADVRLLKDKAISTLLNERRTATVSQILLLYPRSSSKIFIPRWFFALVTDKLRVVRRL